MKTQIIEKNNFPKPLGMLLIFFLISITCFANLAISSRQDMKNSDMNQSAFSKTEINTGLQQFDPLKGYFIKY